VAATGAHSFGLDHRAAGAPVTLRYVGMPPASRLGRGSDAAPRNAVWNVGARPSREVDRGRHDFSGCAAIPSFRHAVAGWDHQPYLFRWQGLEDDGG
jgi:hypothetical protein